MANSDSRTRVTILTGEHRIRGYIDLLPGARLTDYVINSKDFIAVTDAEIFEPQLGGRQVLAAPFIDVSRAHVQVIAPAD